MKYNHRANLLRERKTDNNKQANKDVHWTVFLAWDGHIKYVAGLNRLVSAQPSPNLGQWCDKNCKNQLKF